MDYKKFAELILEVCNQSKDDNHCGSVKLNKLLFFIDFNAYATLGHSISGQTYRKLKHGPVPEQILPVLQEMMNNGDIEKEQKLVYDYTMNTIVANRVANTAMFTKDELTLIETTINKYKDKNGRDVERISHDFIGWGIANLKEEIPYQTVYISDRELTQTEKDYAIELRSLDDLQQCYA